MKTLEPYCTYCRDCAATPEAGVVKVCRGCGNTRAWRNKGKGKCCYCFNYNALVGKHVKEMYTGRPISVSEYYALLYSTTTCPDLGFLFEDASPDPNLRRSIDRVDPREGYVRSNLRVVSHLANVMRKCCPLEEWTTRCAYIREVVGRAWDLERVRRARVARPELPDDGGAGGGAQSDEENLDH